MSTTKTIPTAESTGAGRQKIGTTDVAIPDQGTGRSQLMVGVLTETVPIASFTDGGATVGTYQMAGSLPAGATVLGSRVLVPGGFAGDTSAALTIGDGSDVDRYNTSTVNIFTTAAAGIESGIPSGTKLLTAANRPTLTVTTAADFTSAVTNGSGIVTVSIYFVQA